jgi:hydroxymethylglutaryl-CoA reductase (NADPH)
VPVGVAGPLTLTSGRYSVDSADGRLHETGRSTEQVYVPLAHTEGGLTASMLRGMSAVNREGGVRTWVLRDRMTRASCFVFQSVGEAVQFAAWIGAHAAGMRAWLGDPENPLRSDRSPACPAQPARRVVGGGHACRGDGATCCILLHR